jgi:HAT1-interacting factor 1
MGVEQKTDALAGGQEEPAAQDEEGEGEAEGEGEEDEEEEEEEGAHSAAAASGGGASESKEAPEEDIEATAAQEEVTEDVDIAWESLDVARTIYEKLQGTENQLWLARTQARLADCAMELELFPQAIDEYKASLAIRGQLLQKWDRCVLACCALRALFCLRNRSHGCFLFCHHLQSLVRVALLAR